MLDRNVGDGLTFEGYTSGARGSRWKLHAWWGDKDRFQGLIMNNRRGWCNRWGKGPTCVLLIGIGKV
jgi:hypothetical protein